MRKSEESFLPAEIVDGKKKKRKRKPNKDRVEKDTLWYSFFRLPKVSQKWRFNHSITTDGISLNVSLVAKTIAVQHKYDKGRQKKKKRKLASSFDFSHLAGRTIVGVDPGKINLVYMTSDSNTPTKKIDRRRMRHTSKQRWKELNVVGMREEREFILSSNPDVVTAQESLSILDSKSSSVSLFLEWLKTKERVHTTLSGFYRNIFFRQQRMWSRRKRQRSEDSLLHQVVNKFGKDCVLAWGDWGASLQTPGMPSTPNCRLRRKLSHHLLVVDVPEANTSKLCCKCGSNLKGEKKMQGGKEKEIRGLRRCINDKCRVRISRDYNAAINIRLNLLHKISNGDWMERFKHLDKDKADAAPTVQQAKSIKRKCLSVTFSTEKVT